jgi:DNA-binding transcriptional MerR regulator
LDEGFMDADKENWYRTGAAARQLNTSQHTIRELAKAGLIETQMRNGYRYIPAREIERLLSEGLPPTPANADLEGTDDQQSDSPPRTRSRGVQELYAEPSRQLARSKEKVLVMENEVEAKRLQNQSRQLDRNAREEQARSRQARQVQDWRAGYIRLVVERVPGQACASACEQVDALLNRIPPLTNIMPRVQEIIEAAREPIRSPRHAGRVCQRRGENLRPDDNHALRPQGSLSENRAG